MKRKLQISTIVATIAMSLTTPIAQAEDIQYLTCPADYIPQTMQVINQNCKFGWSSEPIKKYAKHLNYEVLDYRLDYAGSEPVWIIRVKPDNEGY